MFYKSIRSDMIPFLENTRFCATMVGRSYGLVFFPFFLEPSWIAGELLRGGCRVPDKPCENSWLPCTEGPHVYQTFCRVSYNKLTVIFPTALQVEYQSKVTEE